jgi:hypothetical protein
MLDLSLTHIHTYKQTAHQRLDLMRTICYQFVGRCDVIPVKALKIKAYELRRAREVIAQEKILAAIWYVKRMYVYMYVRIHVCMCRRSSELLFYSCLIACFNRAEKLRICMYMFLCMYVCMYVCMNVQG